MQRRGDTHIILDSIIHIVIFILFFSGMFWFVTSYNDGAVLWEDFYAKQIANLINNAEPGMEIKVDVTRISGIAIKRGKDVKRIVDIDNVNNRVIVDLRNKKGASFAYFNNVDIIDWKVVQLSGGATTNRFEFKVIEKQRRVEV